MSSSAAAGNILTKYLWSRKPHTVSVCTCDSQLACPFEMWVKHTCCCWPFNSWSVSSASFLSPSHLPELAQTCLLSGQFVWKFKLGVHQVITVPCLLDSGVPRPFGFLSSAWHISLASALDLISSVGCKSLAEFPLVLTWCQWQWKNNGLEDYCFSAFLHTNGQLHGPQWRENIAVWAHMLAKPEDSHGKETLKCISKE